MIKLVPAAAIYGTAAAFTRLPELTGRIDAYRKAAAVLCKTEPTVQTAGKLPEADIVFLDEIFKCSDRVLRSTRLEDGIYADVRSGDEDLAQVEEAAAQKLRSFPALSRDVYQSFYSLTPRRREDAELSAAARKFNGPILDHVTQKASMGMDFSLKAFCQNVYRTSELMGEEIVQALVSDRT